MITSEPEREHQEFASMVHSLTRQLERGEFGDRVLTEHLMRVLGAASYILAVHPVDGLGRCRACRSPSPWLRRRAVCVVHDSYGYFLKGRARFLDVRSSERKPYQ